MTFSHVMAAAFRLLREERTIRPFFAAHLQSAIGTGAALPALLLVAYDQLNSPWAVSLVLMADMLPAVLFGSLAGAVVDRWPRRRCAVIADLGRAAGFAGIVVSDHLAMTVALAAVIGVSTALFRPAVLAGLPSLVAPERKTEAMALYSGIASFDLMGSALGAAALVIVSPTALLGANAVTFAISAALLARAPFGTEAGERETSLWTQARDGLGVTFRLPIVRAVVISSSGVLLSAGLFSVAELPLAVDELGASDAGFSALVACFGVGLFSGSLFGARADTEARARRGYLLGVAAVAAGFGAVAVAPGAVVAALSFMLAGVGNGLVVVHERLLIERESPPEVQGRVFGAQDALGSALFAAGFALAGVAIALAGPRATMAAAAGIALVALALARWAMSLAPARDVLAAT